MVDIDIVIDDIINCHQVKIESMAIIAEHLGGDPDVIRGFNHMDMATPTKVNAYLFALIAKKLKGGE